MKPLERSIQASVARRLRALHQADPTFAWRKRHGSAFATAGDPDITGLWGGVHFEIELKQPGENPTPLQRLRLEEWRRAGAWCGVAHSTAELEAALESIRARRIAGA